MFGPIVFALIIGGIIAYTAWGLWREQQAVAQRAADLRTLGCSESAIRRVEAARHRDDPTLRPVAWTDEEAEETHE